MLSPPGRLFLAFRHRHGNEEIKPASASRARLAREWIMRGKASISGCARRRRRSPESRIRCAPPRHRPMPATIGMGSWILSGGLVDLHIGLGGEAGLAGKDMPVALREDQDIARFQLDGFLVHQPRPSNDPLRDHMIFDHMAWRRASHRARIPSMAAPPDTQGALTVTSKNAAPFNRMVRNTSERASAATSFPPRNRPIRAEILRLKHRNFISQVILP